MKTIQEQILEQLEKGKKWITQPKHWRMVLCFSILFLYLAGLLAQFLNIRSKWIPGNDLRLPSINPFKCLAMLFTPFGVQAIAGLFLFLTVIILFIWMNREDRAKMRYDKERNFWYSEKGVYGTAGWMSDKELRACFDVTPEEDAGKLDEIIYGCKDGMVVSRKADSMLGPHIAVMGSSGSMKSRTISRAMIISTAKKGNSLVVSDPKGELAADTMEYLKGYGYTVKVLNVVDPYRSHRFDGLEGARENPLFVSNIVQAVIDNTGGGIGDPIYDAAEGNLLSALIFLQFERDDIDYPSLKGAYQVLLDTGDTDDLDAYFDALQPPSRALMAYNLFRKASDNMRGNICLGLGVRLSVLQNEEIADLMCGNDMDLEALGKKKTAYFLILSDQDTTTRFVAATFFSLLFLRLVRYADMECEDRKLPIPVTLLLDEFCSIVGSINGFPQKLSNIRSRGIQVCIVFQQLGQLMNRFPDNLWSEILGNTDTIICLGCSADPVTAEYISKRSGEVTIYADTVMRQRNIFTPSVLQPNYRHSEGAGRRMLLTQDEVMRLPSNKMLVMVRGQQILELEKFDYTRNPEAAKFKPAPVRGLSIVPQPVPMAEDEALSVLKADKQPQKPSPSGSGAAPEAPQTISPLGKKSAGTKRQRNGKGVITKEADNSQLRIDDYIRYPSPVSEQDEGKASEAAVSNGQNAASGSDRTKTNGVQSISKPNV